MVNKQDYMNAIYQDIEMVRGDTLAFDFELEGLGSRAAYTGLSVSFCVAEHYDESILVQIGGNNGITLESYDADKDLALFSVSMAPRYTARLDIGRYYYDLQIKDGSNNVTLMRGSLTLVYDVTK